ncbi:MAG: mechanosensitive ion channel family protein [Defluviitaleaceae bacterium]|nr:mechanosensitive ion channel family protein [Defluviitaleaceae bacterium]
MLYNFLNSDYLIWEAARAAVVLLVTMVVAKGTVLVWRALGRNTVHHIFVKNLLRVAIWTIGLLVALTRFSQFDDALMAVVAGSGILAIMIGLAAQESLGNAFNGIFLSISKPFEVGDRIHLVNADITGFIEDISIRHTVVRTFTNSRIIVPNSVINKELIENSNFCNPQASSFIDVTVTYGSDLERAMAIMAEVIGNHPDFIDTRAPEIAKIAPKVPVFVRNLGLFGVELRASMWTATVTNNFAASSSVRMAIFYQFSEEGIKFASSNTIDPRV